MNAKQECDCYICRDQLDFELDDFLLDEIERGNVVIFAGSGVSTENRLSSPHTLYTDIAHRLGLSGTDLAFPDLMQKFAERPDGQFELFRLIQQRFDRISFFSELNRFSKEFFSELSTMPYINTYITTNWDRIIEEECCAKPFVYDSDLRFWDVPERKVLKIHGTIDDYSSMIVTRDDYDRSLERLKISLLGGKLKEILANKTCIFSGYSMQDDDFQEIFSLVRDSQGRFSKEHYFVSPYANKDELPDHINPIKTDGTHFLSVVKQHFSKKPCYIGDEIYEQILDEIIDVREVHKELWKKYSAKEFPQMLLSASYQDGLIHGYENAISMKSTGKYSDCHYLRAKLTGYEDIIKKYRKAKSYFDVAYFRGYQNTIMSILVSKDEGEFYAAPMYYFEKIGEMSEEEFLENFEKLPDIHKSAYRACKDISMNMPDSDGYVMQHMPWG